MRRLLLLRHAKSSWDELALPDWQRPLNERGKRDAPRMGAFLLERGMVPDLIITSPAVRARATTEAVAQAMAYTGKIIEAEGLYHGSPAAYLAATRAVPAGEQSVLLVGHNPGLEELVEELAGAYHRLPTAAIACFALSLDTWAEWSQATRAQLIGIWRPKEL